MTKPDICRRDVLTCFFSSEVILILLTLLLTDANDFDRDITAFDFALS